MGEPSDSEEEEEEDAGSTSTPRSSITPSLQEEFSESEDEDPDDEDDDSISDSDSEEKEDEEEEKKEVEKKPPAQVDFGLDLDVGLNVVKRSVGSSMMQNAQNMAALKPAPEPEPDDDDDDDDEDDDDDGDDGTLASVVDTDDDDRLPPPPAALVANTAAASQQHMYMGAGLSKAETAKRISIMQPVALASGYSKVTVKFSGYADEFEDAFLRVSREELEILVATGDAAKFDLTQATGRCTIEADPADPTIFYLYHFENKIIVCSGSVEYRTDIFAAVPSEVIVTREDNALTLAGQSDVALIVTKDGRLKPLKSVEDLLQGTDSEDEEDYATKLAAAQRMVDAAKQAVAPRTSVVSFSAKRPTMPPPATAPEILSPPKDGPPAAGPGGSKPAKAKKTVFLRAKVPSLHRTKLLCHWLNSLRLRASTIEPVTLDTDFCTGTLLCDLMQRLDPSVQYGEGTIIARPLSKRAALNNIELGISAIFHSNKDVRRTRIAPSIHIYEGDVPRIGSMLDEIFVAFAHKPLFAALPAMLDWYNEVLTPYGLALPRDRIVKARKGGEGLWELRAAFQSGLALFCVVHYFIGPNWLGDRALLVDPSRIYSKADTLDKCRINVSYVLSLLAALGVDVLWEVENWVACADLEFVVLQLQLVWDKFREAPCALPDLVGEPETLLLTTVSVSTAVSTDKEGRRSVVGMIYADSMLAQTHPSAPSSSSSSSASSSSSSSSSSSAAATPSSSAAGASSPRLPLSPHASLRLSDALVDADKDKFKSPPAWNKATIEDLYGVTDNPNEYAQIARLHQAAGLQRSEGGRHYETSRFREGHKGGQPPEEAPRLQLVVELPAPDIEAQLEVLAETRRRMEQDQAVILREIERLEDELAEGYTQLEEQSEQYDAEGYEERLEVLEAERVRLERERDKCLDVFSLRYDALRMQQEALGGGAFSASAGGSSSPASPRLTSTPAKKPALNKSSTHPSPSSATASPSRRASMSPPAAQVMVTRTHQSNLILKKTAASSEAYVAAAYTPPSRRRSMVAELFEKNQRAAELASPVYAPPLEAFNAFKVQLGRESQRWARMQQSKGAGPSRREESVYKIKVKVAAAPSPRRIPLPPPAEDEDQARLPPAAADASSSGQAVAGVASIGSVLQAIRAEELGRMSYEDSRRVLVLQLSEREKAAPEAAQPKALREVSDENKSEPLRVAAGFPLMVQSTDDALADPVEAVGLLEAKAVFAAAPRPLLTKSKKPMLGIDSDEEVEDIVGNWIDDDDHHHHHHHHHHHDPPPPPPPLPVTPPATLPADRNLNTPSTPPATRPADRNLNTPSTPPATRPADRSLNTPSTPPPSVPADCSLHPAETEAGAGASSAPTPAPSIVARVSEEYVDGQDSGGSALVGAIKAWRRLSLNELDGDDEAAAAAARGPYPEAEEVPARSSEKTSAPPKATTMTARRRTLQNASRKERLKWLSVPRSVTVEDTKKTASLYPKNATMVLRTQLDEADPQNQDKATYSLVWWESAGLQLVSPSKPPSFQVLVHDVVEIRQGELRDAAKLTLVLSDSADFKASGGRKLVVFKCMSIDDATEYRDLLSSLIGGPHTTR